MLWLGFFRLFRRRHNLLIALVVALVSSLSWLTFSASIAEKQSAGLADTLVETAAVAHSGSGTQLESIGPAEAPGADISSAEVIDHESWIVEDWERTERRKARGLFFPEELDEYASYPDQALVNLLRAGDLKAMHVLANRLLDIGELELALDVYRRAAVYGSTNALKMLGIHFNSQAENDRLALDESENLIVGLGYLEAAAALGDLSALRTGLMYLDQEQLSLSESQKDQIAAVSGHIIEQIQTERDQLGLPQLDRSIDTATRISLQQRYSAENNPSGWGLKYYQ